MYTGSVLTCSAKAKKRSVKSPILSSEEEEDKKVSSNPKGNRRSLRAKRKRDDLSEDLDAIQGEQVLLTVLPLFVSVLLT